jgi:SAM-dependent methyltransferase
MSTRRSPRLHASSGVFEGITGDASLGSKKYDRAYYEQRQQRTEYSAAAILEIVLRQAAPVASAADVGCGVGTWLRELQSRGVEDIQGIDGPWVESSLLCIPQEKFRRVNLGAGEIPPIERRFDLAISLEVAEHLGADLAERFVALLTGLSDQVLFSAAVPGQGGGRHLNEQWQSYWAGLFAREQYALFDVIRPRVWNDDRMPYWYRQNMFLYVRRGSPSFALVEQRAAATPTGPLDIVHPVLFRKRSRPRGSAWTKFKSRFISLDS